MSKVTAQQLAKLIYEELERDGWGDIDPSLFRMIAEGAAGVENDDEPFELMDDSAEMEKVLVRVCERLNGA